MARYIDADALMAKHTLTVRGEWDDTMPFEAVPIPYIKGAPTADVQEVRHGRWERLGQGFKTVKDKTVMVFDPINARCSLCGGLAGIKKNYLYPHNIHDLLYPYCPHCGAKMDRKEGD